MKRRMIVYPNSCCWKFSNTKSTKDLGYYFQSLSWRGDFRGSYDWTQFFRSHCFLPQSNCWSMGWNSSWQDTF